MKHIKVVYQCTRCLFTWMANTNPTPCPQCGGFYVIEKSRYNL